MKRRDRAEQAEFVDDPIEAAFAEQLRSAARKRGAGAAMTLDEVERILV